MLHKNAVEPAALELLNIICQQKEFNAFALGGGTSVAIRKGHRLSVDLDFFSNKTYETRLIYKIIISFFPRAELLFEQNQTMMFLINGVKVDFVLYPFEWLKPFEVDDKIRLISLHDIIPMKLQAISNRFSKKDFWDIDELLNDFTLPEMISIFKQKFPPIDTGHIIHRLINFDTAENEANPVALNRRTWEEIKINLKEKVNDYTQSFL